MRRTLKIISFLALFTISARAQTAPATATTDPTGQPASQAVAAPAQAKADAASPAEQYQSSLKALAASYDENLKRVTDQNAKIKDLFDKGIVARRDVEQSDKSVADARAKLEEVQKEIASAKSIAVGSQSTIGVSGNQESDTAWSTGNKQIDDLIRFYGKNYGIDPFLVYCVIHQESGFRAAAVSGKGAQGLMQLMPDTASRYGVTNPFDASQNIKAGTHYLKDLLAMFDGNVDLALAAYNAGEGTVMKYGNRVPPYQETKEYVRNITAKYTAASIRKLTGKSKL